MKTPLAGYNYYRIKSINASGKIACSKVVKVFTLSAAPAITVYPNPVKDGVINLQLIKQLQGEYGVKMLNNMGQVIITKQIHHAAERNAETIQLEKYTQHGIYQLEVTLPDGSKVNKNVSVE